MLTARERRNQISEHIVAVGHGSVTQLAERFNVTPETIRRDLSSLESSGLVERVHGGAVAISQQAGEELSYWHNEHHHAPEKVAIARAAAQLLPDEPVSLVIDAGTTTSAFAETLAGRYRGQRWTIVTNSLPAGSTLAGAGIPGVNLVGGTLKAFTRAVVGEQAAAAIAALRADYCFLGTNGISAQHGLSTPDPTEASVKRAMVESANTVVVMADSSKFDHDFLVTFADLSQVNIVVTDSGITPAQRAYLAQHDIQVVIA